MDALGIACPTLHVKCYVVIQLLLPSACLKCCFSPVAALLNTRSAPGRVDLPGRVLPWSVLLWVFQL
jgi:hypothetical protein